MEQVVQLLMIGGGTTGLGVASYLWYDHQIRTVTFLVSSGLMFSVAWGINQILFG